MHASVSIIVNKILLYNLLDTRTLLAFRALLELRGAHMYGWSIRYFIMKFAPINKGGCRDYMK